MGFLGTGTVLVRSLAAGTRPRHPNDYNLRAIKLYERLGFRTAGRIRGAIMLNGSRRYDQVLMDLLRSELEPKHVARFRDLERAAGAAG